MIMSKTDSTKFTLGKSLNFHILILNSYSWLMSTQYISEQIDSDPYQALDCVFMLSY